MNAMTWNDLPGIEDTDELEETDRQCLEEIGNVIRRFGKIARFGVTLLHKHFLLADDELLLEHCDLERRTLTTTPAKATEVLQRRYKPTVWRFDHGRPHGCSYCPTHEDEKGKIRHAGFKEPC